MKNLFRSREVEVIDLDWWERGYRLIVSIALLGVVYIIIGVYLGIIREHFNGWLKGVLIVQGYVVSAIIGYLACLWLLEAVVGYCEIKEKGK